MDPMASSAAAAAAAAGAGGVGGGRSMSSIVGSKKHNKLTNRYEQEVQVAFPLQPLRQEAEEADGGEWLSEEDFQAYSVRGATDRWRDGLRRRVLLYQLQAAHPDLPLVQAIFEPRGRAGPPRVSKAERRQQQQESKDGEGGGPRGGGKRRRGWEAGKGGLSLYGAGEGGSDEEDHDDEDGDGGRRRRSGAGGGAGGGGAEGVAVGRVIKLGPVAKLRNSSLSLAEHRTFQALSRKQQRVEAGADDARPLTAQERQSLAGLEPLVRAEQARYFDALLKWVDSARAPYKPLDRAVGPLVEPFLAQLKARQKAAYPRRYQRHFAAPLGAPPPGQGGLFLPAPAFRDTVKTARVPASACLRVPELPLDIPKDSPIVPLPEAEAQRLVDCMGRLGQKDWVFEDADVLLDLPTLLTLADPTRPWAVPFTVRAVDQQRKVLILHRPLLLPVLSMRDRANVYYGQTVPAALRYGDSGGAEEEEEDPALALETWQLAQLRLVVASDRVQLSGPGLGSEEATEAVLDCEVDYALEWSEEDEGDQNSDTIRHLLLALFSATARPHLAKVDAKASKLVRVTPRDAPQQAAALGRAAQAGRNPAYVSEAVGRLSRILGVLLGQPEGRFVARQEPAKTKEEMEQGGGGVMTVYLHTPELEAAGAQQGSSSEQQLDLHALVDESGKGDTSAKSAWRKWLWPSSGTDHIPGTFVPRAE